MKMPNFEEMAQKIVIRYACSMTSIEKGITEELEAIFNQGYALGKREGFIEGSDEAIKVCSNQWWEDVNSDLHEQHRLAKVIQKEDTEVLAGLATKPIEE